VTLSSAQRDSLTADPAVKAVIQFFDGSITNVQQQAVPTEDEEKAES
jgi:hypothetical protein